MNGSAGVYIVFVVIVAAFFNLLFLLLTLRVLCTHIIGWGRERREAAAADLERPPNLQRVTPAVVMHPGHEVVFARKLKDAPDAARSSTEKKHVHFWGKGLLSGGSSSMADLWVANLPAVNAELGDDVQQPTQLPPASLPAAPLSDEPHPQPFYSAAVLEPTGAAGTETAAANVAAVGPEPVASPEAGSPPPAATLSSESLPQPQLQPQPELSSQKLAAIAAAHLDMATAAPAVLRPAMSPAAEELPDLAGNTAVAMDSAGNENARLATGGMQPLGQVPQLLPGGQQQLPPCIKESNLQA